MNTPHYHKWLHAALLALLLLLPSLAMASNEPTRLVVYLKSGDTQAFELNTQPVVTFDNDKIYISSESFSTEIDNVTNIALDGEPTIPTDISVPNTPSNNENFILRFVDGHTVEVSGIAQNASITVYSINGVAVTPSIHRAGDGATIHLDNLADGLYILRVNHNSYKILKR